jgi:hypothetical protein
LAKTPESAIADLLALEEAGIPTVSVRKNTDYNKLESAILAWYLKRCAPRFGGKRNRIGRSIRLTAKEAYPFRNHYIL